MEGKISHTAQIRVRYADTDKMGFVYYANYLVFFEVGRTEFIRRYYKPYSDIEASGYVLPALSADVEYIRSAYYDDLLDIETVLEEQKGVRIKFYYEVKRAGELLARGHTTHVFTNKKGKPVKVPRELRERFKDLRGKIC